jgi:hypothetical protein
MCNGCLQPGNRLQVSTQYGAVAGDKVIAGSFLLLIPSLFLGKVFFMKEN